MRRKAVWLALGFALIAVGLSFTVPRILEIRRNRQLPKVSAADFSLKAANKPQLDPAHEEIAGKPVRIRIPSLAIDLPVAEGRYNAATKRWTLSSDKAFYAVNTPPANNTAGNTFIYGHNRKGIFRDLANIKRGAVAVIDTDNGHEFYYTFDGALETTPDDWTLFSYQGSPILTVQTCSGLWYQNRQLFTFSLRGAR